MARVVLDTGVVVSALIRKGSPPAQAVGVTLAEHTMLQSRDLAAEYTEVLNRSKFVRVIKRLAREQVLRRLAFSALYVEVESIITDCRDPKDNYLLALALDGHADYLVTGDKDLFVLDPWRGVRIVDAATFLTLTGG